MRELDSVEIAKAYKAAIPLKDAIFEFGNPELIEQYQNTEFKQPELGENSLTGAALFFLQGIQNLDAGQKVRQKIRQELMVDIIAKIQNGELIALGLELPINAKSEPAQIQAHLFSGDINWEKSELKFKNLEFSGARLLRPKTTESRTAQESELKIQSNVGQSEKINFVDLDINSYIDENRAAEILTISPRTLQGYRIKGGGPEFRKFGKAVRYKISDLIIWADKLKKRNTIF